MSTTHEGFASIVQPFFDLDLVLQLGEPIKSGKEATVFRCTAHPKTGHDELALKVYRSRTHRSFKDDSAYREGSTLLRFGGGNTRAARALRAGTCFGRRVQGSIWCGREWEVLCRLHEAGLPVPAPVHVEENAILMELFASSDGAVAPQLSTTRLEPSSASEVFHAICGDVEDMLALNVLHGDLSPYNILWNGNAYRIIDFPQAIDPTIQQQRAAAPLTRPRERRPLRRAVRRCAERGRDCRRDVATFSARGDLNDDDDTSTHGSPAARASRRKSR